MDQTTYAVCPCCGRPVQWIRLQRGGRLIACDTVSWQGITEDGRDYEVYLPHAELCKQMQRTKRGTK